MKERYIYLKNSEGTLKQEMFRCESHRLKILEKWRKLYGKKFSELIIEEEPEIKKYKPKKVNGGKVPFANIVFAARKSTRGFYKSLNGQKD